jgi:hypothetical protein
MRIRRQHVGRQRLARIRSCKEHSISTHVGFAACQAFSPLYGKIGPIHFMNGSISGAGIIFFAPTTTLDSTMPQGTHYDVVRNGADNHVWELMIYNDP